MAVDILLALLSTIFAAIGFLFNAYVIISSILAHQVNGPSNLLLLHLCSLNTLLTFSFLSLQSPNLFLGSFYAGEGLCYFQGFLEFFVHPLIVWNLLGIHLDRFVSIAYPLRYLSKINSARVGFFLGFIWIWVLGTNALPILIVLPIMRYRESFGSCFPDFQLNGFVATSYLFLGILLPISLIIACNLKIVNIAKYHQFRIANALFGMTVSAHHNVEGARARERQNVALKRFQGFNAVVTLSQLVGSLILFYFPFCVVTMYESWAGSLLASYSFVLRLCLTLLILSPACTGFIFGIKNKSLQSSILNFARKEIYKSEVQQEIRLRSPGGGLGSSRPSFGSFVSSLGQVTSQMPYLQRHLSELCLNNKYGPGGGLPQGNEEGRLPRRSLGSCRRSSHYGRDYLNRPKPFKRHASDLTWRMNAAGLTCPRSNSVVDIGVLSATSVVAPISGNETVMRSSSSSGLVVPPNQNSNNNTFVSSSQTDTEDEQDLSFDQETSFGSTMSRTRPRKSSIFRLFENGCSFSRDGSLKKRECPKITITTVPTIDQSSLEFLYPLPSSSAVNCASEKCAITDVVIHVTSNGNYSYDVVDQKDGNFSSKKAFIL